jgi:hypothetical protein
VFIYSLWNVIRDTKNKMSHVRADDRGQRDGRVRGDESAGHFVENPAKELHEQVSFTEALPVA